MKTTLAFCSARDRKVQIALPKQRRPGMDYEGVVCLEIGSKCTGAMCPLGAAPMSVMAVRLVRSGLMPTIHPFMSAMCEACGEVTSFDVIDATHASCTICGRRAERDTLTVRKSG